MKGKKKVDKKAQLKRLIAFVFFKKNCGCFLKYFLL
jgi:hypothetical protein